MAVGFSGSNGGISKKIKKISKKQAILLSSSFKFSNNKAISKKG